MNTNVKKIYDNRKLLNYRIAEQIDKEYGNDGIEILNDILKEEEDRLMIKSIPTNQLHAGLNAYMMKQQPLYTDGVGYFQFLIVINPNSKNKNNVSQDDKFSNKFQNQFLSLAGTKPKYLGKTKDMNGNSCFYYGVSNGISSEEIKLEDRLHLNELAKASLKKMCSTGIAYLDTQEAFRRMGFEQPRWQIGRRKPCLFDGTVESDLKRLLSPSKFSLPAISQFCTLYGGIGIDLLSKVVDRKINLINENALELYKTKMDQQKWVQEKRKSKNDENKTFNASKERLASMKFLKDVNGNMALTLNTNHEYFEEKEKGLALIKESAKAFIKLYRKLSLSTMRHKRIEMRGCAEFMNGYPHGHFILNNQKYKGRLNEEELLYEYHLAQIAWKQVQPKGSVFLTDCYDKKGWVSYMTKNCKHQDYLIF